MVENEKEKRVPNLRFEGFTDDWIKRKLKNIANRVTRKNRYNETNIPLTISDKFGLIDQREYFTKKIASKDMSHYILLKKGEFAYNKSYSKNNLFGTIARLDRYESGALSTLYIAFEVSNSDSSFLLNYYNSTKWHREVSKIANEGARNHGLLNINVKDFFETNLAVPSSFEEQKKIGKILESLEKVITLEQEKIDALEKFQEYFRHNMLVRNIDEPFIRFQGFKKKWSLKTLSNAASIVSGGTPSTKVEEYWNGDINWFTPSEIDKESYVTSSERKITKLGLVNSSAKLMPKNKTILFTSRAGIGNVSILKEDATTNQGFQSLIVTENTDLYFLYSMADIIKREALRVATGSTFLEISSKEMKKIKIYLPNKLEQEKIGCFLENIDALISQVHNPV